MTIEEKHEARRKAAAAREDYQPGPAGAVKRFVGDDGHEFTRVPGLAGNEACQFCGLSRHAHTELHTTPLCSCGGSGLRLSIVPWQCGPVHGMTVFCALCGAIRADQIMGVEQAPGRAVTPDGQPLIYTGV